jgi:hypothetical protein
MDTRGTASATASHAMMAVGAPGPRRTNSGHTGAATRIELAVNPGRRTADIPDSGVMELHPSGLRQRTAN